MSYRPLAYFWVVEFEDGTAYAQFDPETGVENKFPFNREKEIVKFGWCPFSRGFAEKVRRAGVQAVSNGLTSPFVLEVRGGKLRWCRRNKITYNPFTGAQTFRETVYIMGIEGDCYHFITESGEHKISRNFNEVV